MIKDFPVQFLAASGLTEDAVRNAKSIEYEGVAAKVFRPEYLIAIAATVGGHKDFARIEQLLEQAEIDKALLDDILRRHNLKLPKDETRIPSETRATAVRRENPQGGGTNSAVAKSKSAARPRRWIKLRAVWRALSKNLGFMLQRPPSLAENSSAPTPDLRPLLLVLIVQIMATV